MKKKNNVSRWLYWTPRIMSILFTLFIGLFSLDVFGNNYGFWGTLLAFLMHNIPTFILAIGTWIAWKHEIFGAIAFGLFGLWYISFIIMNSLARFEWFYLAWAVQIAGPAFFTAILFFMNWKLKRK